MKKALEHTPQSPRVAHKGKGIVVLASGGHIESALVTAKLLRTHGSKLPIEFWHHRDTLSSAKLDVLKQQDVKPIAFEDYLSPAELKSVNTYAGQQKPQLMPLAVIHSSFTDVLVLSGNSKPVRNADFLLSHPVFQSTAALFWPGLWMASTDSPIWNITSLKHSGTWEVDDVQVLVNKDRAWNALHLALYFSSELYMTMIDGGGEALQIACQLTQTEHRMVKYRATPVGTLGIYNRFCGHSVLQYDLDGEPLFVSHRTLSTASDWDEHVKFDFKMTAPTELSHFIKAIYSGELQSFGKAQPACFGLTSVEYGNADKPIMGGLDAVPRPRAMPNLVGSRLLEFENALTKAWFQIAAVE